MYDLVMANKKIMQITSVLESLQKCLSYQNLSHNLFFKDLSSHSRFSIKNNKIKLVIQIEASSDK